MKRASTTCVGSLLAVFVMAMAMVLVLPQPRLAAATNQTVLLVGLSSLTGTNSPVGTEIDAAIRLAVQYVNTMQPLPNNATLSYTLYTTGSSEEVRSRRVRLLLARRRRHWSSCSSSWLNCSIASHHILPLPTQS